MENNLKVFKSDKFDVVDTASLSLFLYPHSLFIFAKNQNQANIAIHLYQNIKGDDLERILNHDLLLKKDVPLKFFIHQSGFSLVPGVLFHAEKEREYLNFSQELPANAKFFHSPLDSNNLQLVSLISEKHKKSLDSRFSEISLHHGGCSFLSYLFKERFNLIGQEILVCFCKSHSYIAAFTDQELSLFNIFEIGSKEDVLKYVLIVMNQLNYDRSHVRVTIFGATPESGITEEWGKDYFYNFRLLDPHTNQNYSQDFKNLIEENIFEIHWQHDLS